MKVKFNLLVGEMKKKVVVLIMTKMNIHIRGIALGT